MAQVVLDIDDAVMKALRRRAALSGISLVDEVRRILTRAAGLDREAASQRLAEVRTSIGRICGSATEALRRDRDRDSLG